MSKIFGQHLKIGLFQNLILRLEIASESLTEVGVNKITTIISTHNARAAFFA